MNNTARATGVLCLTFSRNASIEMKERIITLLDDETKVLPSHIACNTFHSFGLKLSKKFYTFLNYPAVLNFHLIILLTLSLTQSLAYSLSKVPTIIDWEGQVKYMTEIVKRHDPNYNASPKSEQKKYVLSYFNKFKPISKNLHMDAVDYLIEQKDGALLVKIYNEYEEVPILSFFQHIHNTYLITLPQTGIEG